MKISIKALMILALSGTLASACSSTEKEAPLYKQPTLFTSLQQEAPLQITLETDFASLLRQRGQEKEQSARFTIHREGQPPLAYDIKLSARGKTRKTICEIPPLKLDFDKDVLKEQGLASSDDLKLVAHCMEDAKQLVVKEYLTYRLYNEITDRSFRVQLVELKYVDSKGQRPDERAFAFLIEPKEEMAARLNARLVEGSEARAAIQAEPYSRFTLFQYMAGNTDWNLSEEHNVKLIKVGAEMASPVPYDFDYSGLVNAEYATPHPDLPIRDVSERFFQWRGKTDKGLAEAVDLFLSKKSHLLSIVEYCDKLSEDNRREMLDYLNEFFELISQKKTGDKKNWVGLLN